MSMRRTLIIVRKDGSEQEVRYNPMYRDHLTILLRANGHAGIEVRAHSNNSCYGYAFVSLNDEDRTKQKCCVHHHRSEAVALRCARQLLNELESN